MLGNKVSESRNNDQGGKSTFVKAERVHMVLWCRIWLSGLQCPLVEILELRISPRWKYLESRFCYKIGNSSVKLWFRKVGANRSGLSVTQAEGRATGTCRIRGQAASSGGWGGRGSPSVGTVGAAAPAVVRWNLTMSSCFSHLLRFKVAAMGGQTSLSCSHTTWREGKTQHSAVGKESFLKGIWSWNILRKGNGMLSSKTHKDLKCYFSFQCL